MSQRAQVVVVGAGPAGLSAATALARQGVREVVVLERDGVAGGIPRHCDHQGFGLRDLRRSLTGPRYGVALVDRALRAGVTIRTSATVTEVMPGAVEVTTPGGRQAYEADAVLLATGARERPRAARLVPGDRGAGVFTTGQLQQWNVLHGLAVGRRALVVGAELVSYSAVLTLRHAGVEVVAMVTDQPQHQSVAGTGSLFRLRFGIELVTGSEVVEILGQPRTRSVVVAAKGTGARRSFDVDTVVFTGGWIPDHELARRAGVELDAGTLGPATDVEGRTNLDGLLGAGNLLHPVETADVAARRAWQIGAALAVRLKNGIPGGTSAWSRLEAAGGLEWVWPNRLDRANLPERLSLRVTDPIRRAMLRLDAGGRTVASSPVRRGTPNRHLDVDAALLAGAPSSTEHMSLSIEH